MPDQQTSEAAEPGERALHDPTTTITAQMAPVFVWSHRSVFPIRHDQRDPTGGQARAQRVTVVAAVGDDPRRLLARTAGRSSRHGDGVQRRFEERDFRRGGRGDMYSQRKTLAVDHHHALRTLAALGFPDVRAPFFAGANVASTNTFSQRSRPRASSWPRKARHIASHVPSSSHWRNRRQHVDPLGYPSGRSRHRAPVRSTQRMPSTTERVSTRGRPPRGDRTDAGRCGSIFAHCASVSRTLRLGMRTSGKLSTRTAIKVQVRNVDSH